MRGLSGTNATVLPLKTVAPTGSPSIIPRAQAPRLRTMGLQRRPHVSFSRTEGIVGASVQAQRVRAQFAQLTRPAAGTISGGHASVHSLRAADSNHDLIMQPETRPISQEQLIAEVKGIYEGLMIVEAKCIEVDNQQAILAQADPTSLPRPNNQQWQAILAFHGMLILSKDIALSAWKDHAVLTFLRRTFKVSQP